MYFFQSRSFCPEQLSSFPTYNLVIICAVICWKVRYTNKDFARLTQVAQVYRQSHWELFHATQISAHKNEIERIALSDVDKKVRMTSSHFRLMWQPIIYSWFVRPGSIMLVYIACHVQTVSGSKLSYTDHKRMENGAIDIDGGCFCGHHSTFLCCFSVLTKLNDFKLTN